MRIVINVCFGGFGLSPKAELHLLELGYKIDDRGTRRTVPRDDPLLVQVVEEMGKDADARFSQLKIVTIPDGVDWEIEEYDGWESVHEKHRSWA